MPKSASLPVAQGEGFSKFCAGNLEIAGASRTIREEEIKKCADKGIEFIELPMALDGLAVVVNKENNFAKCLTIKELDIMWNAKSEGKITSWKQINPDFPDEKLLLFAPPSDTGTFDYFTQAVTGKRKIVVPTLPPVATKILSFKGWLAINREWPIWELPSCSKTKIN
jgi:ABC-type phosphate transport system substrate-binding protein